MESKINAFDCHNLIYKALLWCGFYKLHTSNRWLKYLHACYRVFAVFILIIVNVQHFIFIYNMLFIKKIVEWEPIIAEISDINLMGKLMCALFYSKKIDAIHDVIKSPIFGSDSEQDEKYLKRNKTITDRLFIFAMFWMNMSFLMFIVNKIYKRTYDATVEVYTYYPYDTTTWARFLSTVILEVVLGIWTGYGHFALDCIVASYNLQATYQLKIVKYNLEHIFDDDETAIEQSRPFQYKDVLDKNLPKRFIYYVRRYEKIYWLIREVNVIFNSGIAFHFIVLSTVMCMVIYNMILVNVLSLPFLLWIALMAVFQSQNFFYCFFGSLVEHESDSVNTAIYFSNWVSVSPKLRKMIVIAMSRWHYPITLQVFGVVPVSLTTFVAISRFSYSMFTVLKSYDIRQ